MRKSYIAVVDCETTSTDETTTDIVQLAAVVIDPYKLELINGAEFNTLVKPNFDNIDPNTLDFHSRVQKRNKDLILADWESAPDPKVVWPEFVKFLHKYFNGPQKTKWNAPIAAGQNIIKFDLPIFKRYNDQYNESKPIFHEINKVDTINIFWWWFEDSPEVEKSNLDYMRQYFGIATEGGHDALKDVKDCADVIIKFMKLHRRLSPQVGFKGAFN